jgi:uncharacterized cofD-like protein
MRDMKKVVVIGGGSGSFVVLRGLKKFPLDITAVVSAFDSGGSSGILRDEFGVLPPGDIRRCLVALADDEKENIVRELFTYRFKEKSTLNGHSFGNLFLTALTQILGGEPEAIQKAGELLSIKGQVLPVSTMPAHIFAELEDGTLIEGEKNIDVPRHNGDLRIMDVYLKPRASLYRETKKAIIDANLIVIGPGDLYTSLIPNFLVVGMKEAIRDSKAALVYVTNVMTKWGETGNFKASDFAREVLVRVGRKKFDYIIVNNATLKPKLLEKYALEKAFPVVIDREVSQYAREVIEAPVVLQSGIIRHDSEALASVLNTLTWADFPSKSLKS